jgi:hypothetical protein
MLAPNEDATTKSPAPENVGVAVAAAERLPKVTRVRTPVCVALLTERKVPLADRVLIPSVNPAVPEVTNPPAAKV